MAPRRAFLATLAAGLATAAATALAAGGLKTETDTKAIGDDEVKSVTAKCERGSNAVAGGFDTEFDPDDVINPALVLTTSARGGRREWTTTAAGGNEPGDVTTYAYCRDQRLTRVSSTVEFPSGAMGSVTVRCPGKKSAISGGFEATPVNFPGTTPVFRTAASRRAGGDGWRVSTFNNGNDDGVMTVYAHCRGGAATKARSKTRHLKDEGASIIHSLKPRCKRGYRVVAGGYASPEGKGAATIMTSRKRGGRTWLVRARTGLLGSAVDVSAYAYCEKKR